MFTSRTRAVIAAAAVVAATAALAGCSSPSENAAAASTAPTAAAASPSAMVGTDPGTWSPLHVDGRNDGQTISMVPGQVLLVDVIHTEDSDLDVSSSDPNVAEVIVPTDANGEAPVVQAKNPGTATITVTSVNDEEDEPAALAATYTIEVTAQQ